MSIRQHGNGQGERRPPPEKRRPPDKRIRARREVSPAQWARISQRLEQMLAAGATRETIAAYLDAHGLEFDEEAFDRAHPDATSTPDRSGA